MRKGAKIALGIVGGIIAAAGIVMAVNHEATRVVFHNVFAGSEKLDDSKEWSGGTSYEKLQYSDVSENDYMHLYVPDTQEKPPLIVMVHGGGFVFNDLESRQAQFMYRYFRDHGYACATINYRLAQEAKFPAALEDVKCAVRFLRANADQYGYDADHFAIWGESAGGYLAVMAGVTNDEEFNSLPFIGEEELEEPVSARVSTILNFYGCMELESREDRHAEYKRLGIPEIVCTISEQWLATVVKDFDEFDTVEDYWIGKNLGTMSEEEKQVFSPYYYVEKNLTPEDPVDMLIIHGDADLSVPYTQSEQIRDAFDAAQGEGHVDMRLFHNEKHADDNLYSDDNLASVVEYLQKD